MPEFNLIPEPWFNYRTRQYDLDAPPTDETVSAYLPQHPAAMSLYKLRRLQGDDVLTAMEIVLKVSLGESK